MGTAAIFRAGRIESRLSGNLNTQCLKIRGISGLKNPAIWKSTMPPQASYARCAERLAGCYFSPSAV